jgi:hypothetical protein
LKAVGGGANFGTSLLFTAAADVNEERIGMFHISADF